MPDFYPLFDGNGRRVFNASGSPVFARLRNGSITVPYTLSGAWAGNDYYPAGSITHAFQITFTRSSYQNFSSPASTTWLESPLAYLGADYWGDQCALKLMCVSPYLTYASSAGTYPGFVFTIQPRIYLKTGSNQSYTAAWAYQNDTYYSSPLRYLPDGTRPVIEGTHYWDSGMSLSVPSTLDFPFTET